MRLLGLDFRGRGLVAALVTSLAVLIGVAIAHPRGAAASYRGAAGAIAFTDQRSFFDPYNGSNGASSDLYAVRPPSSHRQNLADCSIGEGGSGRFCAIGSPAFSPDGRRVVVASTMGGGTSSPCSVALGRCRVTLTIAAADGRAPQTLQPLTADDEQPAFLPGGQTLVFAGRAQRRAPFNLYTVTTGGTGLQQLTTFGAAQPAPCPNGSIAFVHQGNVFLLSADRRSWRRITSRGGTSPDCSRDGRTIAFVRHQDLYLISSTGTRMRRLTPGHGVRGHPAFSPAGGRIAFITFGCPSQGKCCADGSLNCSRPYPVYRVDVADLRGRVRSRTIAGHCFNMEGETDCDVLDGLAWQP